MKITKPGGTFKCEHNKPLLTENYLEPLSEDYYTKSEDPVYEEATIVDRFTLQLDSESKLVFEAGDNIKLLVDGFERLNNIKEIDNANKRVRLSLELPYDVVKCSIKPDFYIYTINATCPEGYYYFNSLELVIIKNNFQQALVSFSTFVVRNKNVMNLFSAAEYKDYNAEAINAVFADLAHIPKVWNVIDSSQFRELLIQKILVFIEMNHMEDSTKYRDEYEKTLMRLDNLLMLKGKLYDEKESVDVETQSESRFTYHLGA